jgi:hypothetical protein
MIILQNRLTLNCLTAKINNLLLLSTTLKNTYTKHIKVVAPEIVIASADEELLQENTTLPGGKFIPFTIISRRVE